MSEKKELELFDQEENRDQLQILEDIKWTLMSTYEKVMNKLGFQEDDNAKDQD